MKKGYRKYKTSDVILASQNYWPKDSAQELGKRLNKLVIYLPCEVDDFPKAFNTLSYPQLKELLQQAMTRFAKIKN